MTKQRFAFQLNYPKISSLFLLIPMESFEFRFCNPKWIRWRLECRRESYPDNDREQRPAARGQVDVRVQLVLVQVGVGKQ